MDTNIGPPARLLSVADTMAYLSCSRTTIYRHIDAGLPVIKLGGRVFFDLADLNAYIDANRSTAGSTS